MASHANTRRATSSATGSEGKSRALPAGTKDQSLFWRDCKHLAAWIAAWMLGGLLLTLLFAQLMGAF